MDDVIRIKHGTLFILGSPVAEYDLLECKYVIRLKTSKGGATGNTITFTCDPSTSILDCQVGVGLEELKRVLEEVQRCQDKESK